MVNTRSSSNKPQVLSVDGGGRADYSNCFETYEYRMYGGCSLMWNNRQFYYGSDGGGDAMKQILELKKSSQESSGFYFMDQIGSLPWKMDFPSCTNMGGKIFVCFDNTSSSNYKKCYYSTDPLFKRSTQTNSIHKHNRCRISSSDCK